RPATGGVALVVWDELVMEDGLAPTHHGQIHAARVDRDGVLLDAIPLELDPLGGRPRVAAGAGGFLVAYQAGSAGSVVRVAEDGTVGPPSALGTRGRGLAAVPHLAFDGTRFLVAHDDTLRFVDATGLPEGTAIELPE